MRQEHGLEDGNESDSEMIPSGRLSLASSSSVRRLSGHSVVSV